MKKLSSARATRALDNQDASLLSHLVGVTNQDLDASALSLPIRFLDRLDNNDAPAFLVAAGNPNTGKTNTALLLAELRRVDLDDLLIISNFDSSITDHVINSAHELTVNLLEHRTTPKFVILDEGSTHFDSRTYRHEVATQWTPLAKRFAKLGVDTVAVIGHTGKDIHPELKRMATTSINKPAKKTAEVFDRWPADADFPVDRLFNGDLTNLEETQSSYDPNDAAPWDWNLEPELFTLDLDWSELLSTLKERGPSSS